MGPSPVIWWSCEHQIEHLQSAGVLHADEASWTESKQMLWLWVLCCSHTVLYVIGARTKEMFDNSLSAAFMGMLMSDGYRAYRLGTHAHRPA